MTQKELDEKYKEELDKQRIVYNELNPDMLIGKIVLLKTPKGELKKTTIDLFIYGNSAPYGTEQSYGFTKETSIVFKDFENPDKFIAMPHNWSFNPGRKKYKSFSKKTFRQFSEELDGWQILSQKQDIPNLINEYEKRLALLKSF
jgi:hypothetical protein